jgi:hypothetical protein
MKTTKHNRLELLGIRLHQANKQGNESISPPKRFCQEIE